MTQHTIHGQYTTFPSFSLAEEAFPLPPKVAPEQYLEEIRPAILSYLTLFEQEWPERVLILPGLVQALRSGRVCYIEYPSKQELEDLSTRRHVGSWLYGTGEERVIRAWDEVFLERLQALHIFCDELFTPILALFAVAFDYSSAEERVVLAPEQPWIEKLASLIENWQRDALPRVLTRKTPGLFFFQ